MSFFQILLQLCEGLGYSVMIFLLTLVFSLPLGLLICFGRMTKIKPVSWLFRIYISIMRGTPLMLQLFVVYFCPYYLFRIPLRNMGDNWMFVSVIIGFALNYAAYFAEIYRSGIASMSEGQYEAARVLGMNKRQTFFIIILPQVIRRILPSLTNEVITLVKDTSLAFAIGQIEMFTMAKRLASSEVSMLPYVGAAMIYYVFNLIVATAMAKVEKRFSNYVIK
ncbi:MAG: amino acid ABC transporter permease [Clostridia bacterium]|nr:amino acid ABC transporter permease [Clostridia bacterium]MBQ8340415.1 amino acid ABC transporter permease [Clostridia bacterium]